MARSRVRRWGPALAGALLVHGGLLLLLGGEGPRAPRPEAISLEVAVRAPPTPPPPAPAPSVPSPEPPRRDPTRRAADDVPPQSPAEPGAPGPVPVGEEGAPEGVPVDGVGGEGGTEGPLAPSLAQAARPIGAEPRKRVPYPREAILARAAGEVWLLLEVDAEGHVVGTRAVKKVGYGLERVAADVAYSLRFSPARDVDGRAVASRVYWRMSFDASGPVTGPVTGPMTDDAALGRALSAIGAGLPKGRPAATVAARSAPPAPRRSASGLPAAANVSTITEEARRQLCVWTVTLRGGPGVARGCTTEEPVDFDDIENLEMTNDFTPAMGPDGKEIGPAKRTVIPARGSFGRFENEPARFVFTPTEARCVSALSHGDDCQVTVEAYERCMRVLARDPCLGLWSRACADVRRCRLAP